MTVCAECGKGIGHFLECSQHEEHDQAARIAAAVDALSCTRIQSDIDGDHYFYALCPDCGRARWVHDNPKGVA